MADPRLLRTPLPEPGEHYLGYVLRLARKNGHLGFRGIAEQTGLVGKRPAAVIQDWIGGTLDLTALSQCTGHTKERLKSMLLLPPRLEHNDAAARDWRLKHFRTIAPRLCPRCLVDRPFIRAVWDLTPLTYCREHQLVLVDQCTRCSRRLSWTRPSPNECQCGFDYRQATTEAVEPATAEWLKRNGFTRNAVDPQCVVPVDSEQVDALHRVTARLYRPLDLMQASPDFNIVPNRVLHALYIQAATLRCRPDAWRRWQRAHRDAHRRQFPILSRHVYPWTKRRPDPVKPVRSGHDLPRPASIDETSVVVTPVIEASGMQAHQQRGVSPLRWTAAQRVMSALGSDSASAETALARQIDLATLARALCAKPADIHSLSEECLIDAVHAGTPRYVDWLFDIADLEALFAALPIKRGKTPAAATSLTDVILTGQLTHHNTTLGRLLKGVQTGNLAMWRTSAEGLEGFVLGDERLNRWLMGELHRPLDAYNFGMLARLLDTPVAVVAALSALGFLPLHTGGPGCSKRDYSIAGDTVRAFRQRYIVLNAVAHASARQVPKLRARVDDQGIQPSYSRTHRQATVVLYKRSPANILAIGQALGHHIDARVRRVVEAPSGESAATGAPPAATRSAQRPTSFRALGGQTSHQKTGSKGQRASSTPDPPSYKIT